MRKWLYETIISSPKQAMLTEGRVYGPGAVEGDEPGDSPTRPFIIARFSSNQPAIGRIKQQRVQVWIHWDGASALPADELAADLEDWLPISAPAAHSDGWMMACKWEETSGDGFDDHYQTNTRFLTFLITYRPAA